MKAVNADFSDNRINFSTTLLQAGQNTINIYMRQTGKLSTAAVILPIMRCMITSGLN